MSGVTPVLVVAHGSRDPRSQEVVTDLVAQLAERRAGLAAAAAYVDNASPSVRVALEGLVAAGERDVVVLPLLLSAASHSKTDVAASVQAGRLAHPGVTLRYGRPLGSHPAVVAVLAQRLAEAGATDEPVVLAAGGSLDPDANAQLAATARLLWEGRDYVGVDLAFASTARPGVAEAVARLVALGHRRVALGRCFLGPGYLPDLVERQAREALPPGAELVVGEPLGAAPELAALLLERYDEALAGTVAMNCDACQHRVPWPGREVALGAPQRPHDHPDDPPVSR